VKTLVMSLKAAAIEIYCKVFAKAEEKTQKGFVVS
jgi:hypothetical protein